MKAKEKALELANKFVRKLVFDMDNDELREEREYAKIQSEICVDEIISALKNVGDNTTNENIKFDVSYYEEVKKKLTITKPFVPLHSIYETERKTY